jgi:hypothetical protein
VGKGTHIVNTNLQNLCINFLGFIGETIGIYGLFFSLFSLVSHAMKDFFRLYFVKKHATKKKVLE